ncbi:MAG: MlaC/ttg2D family ABC transporter substrate-binding protein [Candidatus Eutrophobiaceae bacterium]
MKVVLWKRSFFLHFALLPFIYGLPGQAHAVSYNENEHPAMSVVRSSADALLENLQRDRDRYEKNPEEINNMVSELILPNFNFEFMSRFVLGESWRSVGLDQQQQFIEEFRDLMVRTYAVALLTFTNQKIEYIETKLTKRNDLVIVLTKLIDDVTFFEVDYRMFNKGGSWQVVDVVVDGVSLMDTYRNTFKDRIKREGFDSLIDKMNSKNEG